jgi:formate dehydrogenase assembly factor FdhD
MREGLPEADENDGTGRSISITMRTPGHDAELAVGFLCGEGLLRDPRDVIDTGFAVRPAASCASRCAPICHSTWRG